MIQTERHYRLTTKWVSSSSLVTLKEGSIVLETTPAHSETEQTLFYLLVLEPVN